jgi:hypothetical protein
MSCRTARTGAGPAALGALAEHAVVLAELARRGDAVTFKELARCLGVEVARLDELWARALTLVGTGYSGSPHDETSAG